MHAGSDTPSGIRCGVNEFTIIARRQRCRGTGPNVPDDTSAQKVSVLPKFPLATSAILVSMQPQAAFPVKRGSPTTDASLEAPG